MDDLKKTTHFVNNEAGWHYEYQLAQESNLSLEDGFILENGVLPGGLAISDVRHNGYNFANHIQNIGIWVFPVDSKRFQPKFLRMGPPDFFQWDSDSEVFVEQDPRQNRDSIERAPEYFNTYNVIDELKVS